MEIKIINPWVSGGSVCDLHMPVCTPYAYNVILDSWSTTILGTIAIRLQVLFYPLHDNLWPFTYSILTLQNMYAYINLFYYNS